MDYETIIGLEVHLQLKTRTKAFCGCSVEFGKSPNSQACPVCLGFPGSLPVLNKVALDYAIKASLALNCKIQEHTKFDRKNYFYPDLPKNYQISQYDLPLAKDGFLDIDAHDKIKRIGITRVHLEEDAGKLIHGQDMTLVDFNRSGIPLLEIVSQPDINSPQEAYEYLTTLKGIMEYLEISDCDMEKGSLRCDANISIREGGASKLGTKAELKNMNSFKATKDALQFEIERQTGLLCKGEKIIQETRLWDEKEAVTVSMRSKEEAQDYRYFPEPDLPLFTISEDKVSEVGKTIPELPHEKTLRFMKDYGLSRYDARILVSSKDTADYAEECIRLYPQKDKKTLVNFLIGPFISEANSRNRIVSELRVPAQELVGLIGFLEQGSISHLTAKIALREMIGTGMTAGAVINNKSLAQISDTDSLIAVVETVLKENPKSVGSYKSGKANAIMFLVGQVMKKTGSRANPKIAQDILRDKLREL